MGQARGDVDFTNVVHRMGWMTDPLHTARVRLVEHLERLAPAETACEATLFAELRGAVPDMDALRRVLGSIGAVRVRDGWCLSDGAPPGWAWGLWVVDGAPAYVLARAGENRLDKRFIASVRPGHDWYVQHAGGRLIEARLHSKVGLAAGQREAIRECRIHGLFAEMMAVTQGGS